MSTSKEQESVLGRQGALIRAASESSDGPRVFEFPQLGEEKQRLPPSPSHQSPGCHPRVHRPLFLPLPSFYERTWRCSTNRAGSSSPHPALTNEQLPFLYPPVSEQGRLSVPSPHVKDGGPAKAHLQGQCSLPSGGPSEKDGSSPTHTEFLSFYFFGTV